MKRHVIFAVHFVKYIPYENIFQVEVTGPTEIHISYMHLSFVR